MIIIIIKKNQKYEKKRGGAGDPPPSIIRLIALSLSLFCSLSRPSLLLFDLCDRTVRSPIRRHFHRFTNPDI